MALTYRYLFPAIWIAWVVYWWLSARGVKVSVRTESILSQLMHGVPLSIAVVMLGLPRMSVPVLGARFLPLAVWPFWVGAALTIAGLLFTVWARVHLAGNWSGIVTVKQGHELITSGPYSIVRHPIYSGLLLAFIGSALARGEWRGVLAVALAAWAFRRKLRIEERWMREEFGSAYETYSERVGALIPFIP